MRTNTNGFALPSRRAAFALLAAGAATRFGGDKLLADLAGKPVWRWAADAACGADLPDIHVVTNDSRIAAECFAVGWQVHPNPDAESGIGTSIAVAAAATAYAARTVFALADMPLVEAAHLAAIAAMDGVVFTRQPDGRPGVPAAFPQIDCKRLKALAADRGAASLDWPTARIISPPTPDSVLDIDTPATLERARAIAVMQSRAASR